MTLNFSDINAMKSETISIILLSIVVVVLAACLSVYTVLKQLINRSDITKSSFKIGFLQLTIEKKGDK